MSPSNALIVSDDETLEAEFAEVLASLPQFAIRPFFFKDVSRAREFARDREPAVICIETGSGDEIREFSAGLANGSGQPLTICVYRPDLFGPDAGEGPFFIAALRAGARDFLRRPLAATEVRQVLERHLTERPPARTRPGQVVSFVSSKGGVGKSTLAVNVACALARAHPDRVLLADFSLQLGVCATMLDVAPTTTIMDAVREHERLDESLLRRLSQPHPPSGLRLLAAPRNPVDAAHVDERVASRILALARRAFDFVVVDTFPLLDGLVMAVLDASDAVCAVTSSGLPSVLGVQPFLDALHRVGVAESKVRLVLNNSQPNFNGKLTPLDVARNLLWRADPSALLAVDGGLLGAIPAALCLLGVGVLLPGVGPRSAGSAD